MRLKHPVDVSRLICQILRLAPRSNSLIVCVSFFFNLSFHFEADRKCAMTRWDQHLVEVESNSIKVAATITDIRRRGRSPFCKWRAGKMGFARFFLYIWRWDASSQTYNRVVDQVGRRGVREHWRFVWKLKQDDLINCCVCLMSRNGCSAHTDGFSQK